jgi:hypothetical protein
MKELKLNYVEVGRLSNDEMNNIFGGEAGRDIHCGTRVTCGETGKNSCTSYWNCSNNSSKNSCDSKSWVVGSEIDNMDVIVAELTTNNSY